MAPRAPWEHRYFSALAGACRREDEVRVGEHAGNVGRPCEGIGEHSHKLLHLRGTHMCLPAEKIVEVVPVVRQPKLFCGPCGEGLPADGDKLRVHERDGAAHAAEDALGAVVHRRGFLVRGIHAVRKPCVDKGAVHARCQVLNGGKAVGKSGRSSAQGSSLCLHLRDCREDGLQLGFPRFRRGEQAFRVPPVFLRYRGSGRQGFGHGSSYPGGAGAVKATPGRNPEIA